jgi:hypothetical protein
MKTLFALALTLTMALCAVTCSAGEPAMRADAAYGVRYAQEQVIQLPQDQGRFYLTVFGNDGEYRYEQVKSWIASDPQLNALKTQTIYNTYRVDSVMYRERYAQGISDIPCVRLQTAQGQVVFEATGTNIPMSAEALYNGIAEGCRKRHCRPCPQPAPVNPQPTPVNPSPQPQPPIVKPDPKPVVHDFPSPMVWVGLIVAGLAIGGGIGVGGSLKKEFKGK